MKRKFVAFLLSTMLITPQFVYATSDSAMTTTAKSEQFKQAIVSVKSQINVPEALSKFTFSEEDNTYQLSWENPEHTSFINVTCALDGDILNYYSSDDTETYSSVAVVDYTKAQKAAEDFLNQVAKNYMSDLILKQNNRPNQGMEYVFVYELVHDSIKVYHQEVEIRVSKQTGKVTSFNGIHYHADANFEEKTPTLSVEEAKKAYLDKIGLDLNYMTYYDEETEKNSSFLAYEIENNACEGISAKTGEVVKGQDRERIWYENATEDAASMTGKGEDGGALTEAEQQEVAQYETLLEPTEILNKAKTYFPALSRMEMTSSYLNQDSQKNYRRQMTFEKKNAENEDKVDEEGWLNVNAVTGEIWGYSYYASNGFHANTENQKKWTTEDAKAFIQKVDPVASQTLQYVPQEVNNTSEQYFYFDRLVNGIPVDGDGIEVRYEPNMGEVTSYYKYWTDTEFKNPSEILTKEQVMDKVGLDLVYMQVEEGQYALVYCHDQQHILLDATSGKEVDYRGQEVKKVETQIYTDIQGHQYEQEIKNLYYSGIYLKTDTLHPDNAITKGELSELLKQAKAYEAVQEEIDTVLGTMTDTQTLTKEQGIACLVAISPYQKVAEATTIFNYPFQDEPAYEKNKGSLTIAYGLDWLPKEMIDPKSNLTKAEAMTYLYHALEDIRG